MAYRYNPFTNELDNVRPLQEFGYSGLTDESGIFLTDETGAILQGKDGVDYNSLINDRNIVYRSVSSADSVLITDKTIICTGAGGYAITLLDPIIVRGWEFDIKNMSTGNISIVGTVDSDTSLVIPSGSVGSYPNLRIKSISTGYIIV